MLELLTSFDAPNTVHVRANASTRLLSVIRYYITPALHTTGRRLGVVVSVVGRINEVNQHRARLVHDG